MTTNQNIIMYQPTMWWEGWPIRLQTSLEAMFFSKPVLQDMDIFQQTQRCNHTSCNPDFRQTNKKKKKKIDLSLTGNESADLPN